MNDKSRIWGCVFSLSGIVILLTTVIIEKPADLTTALTRLLEHFGIALLVVGLVSLMIDLNLWRKYFQERLAETIIRHDYLKTLGKEQLINLETDTLKAFFGTEDIDKEDGFLEFFRAKLQAFIGSPYREDVRNNIFIEFKDDDKKKLLVKDTLCYTCKKLGEVIQDSIQWFSDEDGEIIDFKITIDLPKDSNKDKHKNSIIEFTKDDKRLEKIGTDRGYSLSLNEYKKIDGLKVRIYAEYVVEKNELFHFSMASPSHKMTVTINYPKELQIVGGFVGVANEELEVENSKGLYWANYQSWILPDTGFAFQFKNKIS